jgi:hypothetical protein
MTAFAVPCVLSTRGNPSSSDRLRQPHEGDDGHKNPATVTGEEVRYICDEVVRR